MSWVKFDDGFHDHRKTLGVPLAALGLYVLGLSYSSRHATDGQLSAHVVTMLARNIRKRDRLALADALIAAGLWERRGDDYVIHDFLAYNPSAADRRRRAAELSAVRSVAGSQGGRGHAKSRPSPKAAPKTPRPHDDHTTTKPAAQLREITPLRKQTESNASADASSEAKRPNDDQTTTKPSAQVCEIGSFQKQNASPVPLEASKRKEEVLLDTTTARIEPTRSGRRLGSPSNDWDARVAAVWEELKGAPPSRLSLNDLDALRGRVPLETVTRNLRHYLTTVAPRFHSLRRFAETVGDHDPTRTRSEPGVVTYTPFALQPGRGPA